MAVAVAGRMMLNRGMGKACCATLQDMSGRIQLYITMDAVGADKLDDFKHWDLGDIVGAVGTLFKTKTGELSVKASQIRLLAKALRPPPEQFHGMTDQAQRSRSATSTRPNTGRAQGREGGEGRARVTSGAGDEGVSTHGAL